MSLLLFVLLILLLILLRSIRLYFSPVLFHLLFAFFASLRLKCFFFILLISDPMYINVPRRKSCQIPIFSGNPSEKNKMHVPRNEVKCSRKRERRCFFCCCFENHLRAHWQCIQMYKIHTRCFVYRTAALGRERPIW